ncbi:MAG TPA: hypothetical protein VLU25_01230 [Acidobacteriota bacterium]|nr:hypothetical protein [Acidobacteriota bacterium]
MTIDDIANYCEFKDCQVSLGSPEAGFIHVDGYGLVRNTYNYRRFLALNELGALSSPDQVVEAAQTFKIKDARGERSLDRQAFQTEMNKVLALLDQ